MSKILDIETQHSAEMRVLFDVLKESLNEAKIDIRRNDEPKKNKKSSDSNSSDESGSDESDEEQNKKRNVSMRIFVDISFKTHNKLLFLSMCQL